MEDNKEKVAKLVFVEIATRVVVDKNDDKNLEEEAAMNAAIKKIKENINDMVCCDNVVDIMDDEECPFGSLNEDKTKKYNVVIFNKFNTDEREVVEVSAMSQDEAEKNAIGGLLDGWGVFDSYEVKSKDEMSVELRKKLFGLYTMAADWMQGLNYDEVSEPSIISKAAEILVESLDELKSYEDVYDILTQCVLFVNKDFDHNLTIAEYMSLGGEIVEDLCGTLGEFFND